MVIHLKRVWGLIRNEDRFGLNYPPHLMTIIRGIIIKQAYVTVVFYNLQRGFLFTLSYCDPPKSPLKLTFMNFSFYKLGKTKA